MTDRKLHIALLSGASMIQLCLAMPAFAQAETNLHADGNELQDIIVTANRREESMQKVPVAITAISGDALREEGVTTNQDLAGKVPSLIVGQAAGGRDAQTFTIRGQGSTFGGGPGVPVYLAEVPLPQRSDTVGQIGSGALFYDVRNVQVLKGPQGTLFGRNTTGGAVLVEPAKPTNEIDGYAQVQVGNYDDREIEAMVNAPLVDDKLMVRIAGRFADRDGYTRDITSGKDLDDRHYWTLRGSLLWRPSETIENYLMLTSLNVDQNGSGSIPVGFNLAINPNTNNYQGAIARKYGAVLLNQILAEQAARGVRQTELDFPSLDEQRLFMATDTLSIDLSDTLKLRNIASYARYKTRMAMDLDGTRLPILHAGYGDGYSTNGRQWTEELQLQGNLLDDHLTFTVGGYYEHAKAVEPERRDGASNGTLLKVTNSEKRESTGLYVQTSLDFGTFSPSLEGLRLTGGFRYSWDKKDSSHSFAAGATCIIPGAVSPECLVSDKTRESAPNWLVSLDYQINRNAMVYAKASRGYKSGGYNFNATNAAFLTFGPEFVTTYELGAKTRFNLGSMPVRLNGSYYYSDYKDIQKVGTTTAIVNGQVTGGSAVVNAGAAHIQGIELEATINPVRNFTISGSYSYTDAKYDKFQFEYLSGGQILIDDKSGVPFSFTPKNQFSISARYEIGLDDVQTLTPSLTFSHIDRYYTQITKPAEEPFGYLPQSNLLNLRLEYGNAFRQPLDIAFFMTNVANKTFPIQVGTNYGSNGGSYGSGYARYLYSEPRMYGVQVRYRFGASAR